MTATVLAPPEGCADEKASVSTSSHKSSSPMAYTFRRSNGFVGQLTNVYSDLHQKLTMLTRLFRAHGEFCAQRPWEVIICTLMVVMCVMTMSLYTTTKVCDWNYKCFEDEDIKSSDVIILTITRCLAVMYIYLQFCNLKKLGSKYLLGIAGVFTIFASFMFSIAVINLVGSDLTGLNEALPFFLLLVDLSKASALARFALSSASQDEVKGNIGRGMATLGPIITLDSIVEILVIGVGTISGVKQLETMCCFGCLSVLANYLAFMTFYPACLALVLELSRERVASQPMWQLQKLAKALQEEEEQKPNPVTQRIKIIMSAGLLLVHAHSRWIVGAEEHDPDQSELYPQINTELLTEYMPPKESLHWFYVKKFFSLNMDCSIAVVLAGILAIKYVFAENESTGPEESEGGVPGKAASHTSSVGEKQSCADSASMTCSTPVPPQQTKVSKPVPKEPLPSRVEVSPMPKPALQVTQLPKKSASTSAGQDTNSLCSDSVFERSIEHQESVDSGQGASRRESDSSDKSTRSSAAKENGGSKATFFMGGGSGSDSEASDDADFDNFPKVRNLAMVSVETQTETDRSNHYTGPARSHEECVAILKSDEGPATLSDEEVLMLVNSKHIPAYKLESMLSDHVRGVSVRRQLLAKSLPHNENALQKLPFTNYDYKYVDGACCENVIGYMPIPVGYAGPLLLDGHRYQVPMATTEGCLIASTNRGCRAIASSGGCRSSVLYNGMTRAPVVRLPTAKRASEVKFWLEDPENFVMVSETFSSTSRFAKLNRVQVSQAARYLYIRFVSKTGDAMGMNMVSKGCEKTLNWLNEEHFPDLEILSLSGNFCIDKKPSAVNWIEGRGKSVVSEAVIPSHIIKTVLKTSVPALVDLNISKNLMGSAMAGSIGGFNAHAANVVTAIYIATGQDPAQNVASSSCMTIMEPCGANGDDLFISCTMPSIEVGTVGGGTILPPQAACLEMLGLRGACAENPGENASRLAQVVCATVMAGELSLMSALAAGHLVKSHLKHNRSQLSFANSAPSSPLAPIQEGKSALLSRRMSTPASEPGTCTFKAP